MNADSNTTPKGSTSPAPSQGEGLSQFSSQIADLVEGGQELVAELIGARVPASATLWSSEGLALTVAHAMGRNNEGRVRLWDGREVAAKVLGRDPSNDLALLQLELPEDFKARFASDKIANDVPRPGEFAAVIGRTQSRTQAHLGHVASVGPAWRTRLGAQLERYLEVDAELPRGSAGGPLLNAEGEFLGINTHGLVRGGTTVSATDVAQAVQRLQEGGDRRPGFLGVRFSPARLSDHPERERALLITAVGDDSPAAKAQMKVGDLILAVEGHPVRRGDDLLAALATRADETTQIDLWRGGAGLQVQATPVARQFSGRRGHRGQPKAQADDN